MDYAKSLFLTEIPALPQITPVEDVEIGDPVDIQREYEVDQIIAERPRQGGKPGELEYKVRWVNFSLKDATWEPLDHLLDEAGNSPALDDWRLHKSTIESGRRRSSRNHGK
jgi:hypothetical protein